MAFRNGHGSLSAQNYGTRCRCRCAASKRDVRDLVGGYVASWKLGLGRSSPRALRCYVLGIGKEI